MSKTRTIPELKPQEKIGSLGWKATQPGLSTDTKSYNYTQETTEYNTIGDEKFRRQIIEDAIVHHFYRPAAMSPYSKRALCHRMKPLWDVDGCHPHWSAAQCLCVTSLACCNCSPSHLGIPGYQQNCRPWPKGCPKTLKRGSLAPQALGKCQKYFPNREKCISCQCKIQ